MYRSKLWYLLLVIPIIFICVAFGFALLYGMKDSIPFAILYGAIGSGLVWLTNDLLVWIRKKVKGKEINV